MLHEYPKYFDTSEIFKYAHWKSINDIKKDPSPKKIISDTVQTINNKLFTIVASENYDTLKNQYCKSVIASTVLNRNFISFEFLLLTKTKDSITNNFIFNAKKLISQIKVNGL